MTNQLTSTPTTPVLGGQDIEDLMPVDYEPLLDEGVTSQERDRIFSRSPFRCYPRGLASRRSVAVFADLDAVDIRSQAANDSAQSHQNNEVGRVHTARSGLGDDEGEASQ